jgi:hypothetical protein
MIVAGSACERPAPERSNDTVIPVPSPPDTFLPAPAAIEMPWDSAAGLVFIVSGATPQQAAVVVPALDTTASLDTIQLDLSAHRLASFDLIVSGQVVGQARLGPALPLDIPAECSAWPVVRLGDGTDSVSRAWSVGFRTGRFQVLEVDSLPGLTTSDSSRLVRDIARAASSVPGDTVDALKGTPFVVARAWHFGLATGVTTLIAEVTRALNQEASPAHEHLLLVLERDSTTGRTYRQAYAERSSGGEEMLESNELLVAGLAVGRDQPVVLLARYVGDGVIYSLLQRHADGRWSLRWSSPYTGC